MVLAAVDWWTENEADAKHSSWTTWLRS